MLRLRSAFLKPLALCQVIRKLVNSRLSLFSAPLSAPPSVSIRRIWYSSFLDRLRRLTRKRERCLMSGGALDERGGAEGRKRGRLGALETEVLLEVAPERRSVGIFLGLKNENGFQHSSLSYEHEQWRTGWQTMQLCTLGQAACIFRPMMAGHRLTFPDQRAADSARLPSSSPRQRSSCYDPDAADTAASSPPLPSHYFHCST